MYIETKNVPEPIAGLLKSLGFARPDIQVETAVKVSIQDCGSQGRRGFAVLLDLTTGDHTITRGSWGGANMFNPKNAVDLDNTEHPLPVNGAVIRGSEGHGGIHATIYLNPSNVAPWLPAKAEVSTREKEVLNTFGYKSGYRKETWERMNVTAAEIDALVVRGYVNRNKAGSCSLTTLGKNARFGERS